MKYKLNDAEFFLWTFTCIITLFTTLGLECHVTEAAFVCTEKGITCIDGISMRIKLLLYT